MRKLPGIGRPRTPQHSKGGMGTRTWLVNVKVHSALASQTFVSKITCPHPMLEDGEEKRLVRWSRAKTPFWAHWDPGAQRS